MSVPLLDLKAQHSIIRDEVVAAMMAVVDQQAFILGDPVANLERDVALLSQVPYAIGCANGTDAILLALRALNVGAGDEVITTPFTFFATAGAVHNVGARSVFVDIDPRTFNIAPDAVAAAVKSSTKAVIAVDLFGQMAPVEQVVAASKHVPSSKTPRSPLARVAPSMARKSWPAKAPLSARSASFRQRIWVATATAE